MLTVVLTLIVFSLAVLLMCLGSILGGRRIEGSCGGLKRLGGIESDCGGSCTGKSCRKKKSGFERNRNSAAGT